MGRAPADPELGGQGFGQVKLGLMHEILGTLAVRAVRVRQPGARLRQLRDPRAGRARQEQKERYLHPLLAGDLQLGVLDDRARERGLGPDAAADTRAVRDGDEWVINGHKWFSSNASIADFLIVMAVTDPDAQHVPARVDVHRPGRHAGREDRARRPDDGAPVRALRRASAATPRSSTRTCACPADALLGARGRGLPDRPAAPRPRPHPPLHALARRLAARVRHALRARDSPLRARLAAGREADGPELDRRLGRADAGRAADDAARGVEDGHARAPSAARQEIALIKFYGAGVLHDVVDRALQIHGSLGYSTDLPLEAMYRFARAARLLRRARRGPPPVASPARSCAATSRRPTACPSEHVPTRRAAARERFADLLEAVTVQRLRAPALAPIGRVGAARAPLLVARACVRRPLVDGGALDDDAPRAPRARERRGPKRADRFDGARARSPSCARAGRARPAPGGLGRARARLAARPARALPARALRAGPASGPAQRRRPRCPARKPAIVVGAHYDTKALPGLRRRQRRRGAARRRCVELARALRRAKRPRARPSCASCSSTARRRPTRRRPTSTRRAARLARPTRARHARRAAARSCCSTSSANKRPAAPARGGLGRRALGAPARGGAARRASARRSPTATQGEILDDHTPFPRAGVPAIDLIDFDYPCWHKRCDDLRQVSRALAGRAGEAVLELLRERCAERRPPTLAVMATPP